jgi:ABC-2 type transport system ATP-binding protein
MLRFEAVSKTYKNGVRALDNVSFDMRSGEIVGFIGENGAGKTSLMKCVSKALFLSSGKIEFNGIDIQSKSNALDEIGFLISSSFYNHLSAYENLIYYLKIHGNSNKIKEIKGLLESVGLYKRKDDKVSTFSFGMKQRLALVMCLITKPKLLILDEPFIGLDHLGKEEMFKVIKKSVIQDGTMALISSHQFDDLEKLCDRFIFIKDGRIAYDGKADFKRRVIFKLDKPYKGKLTRNVHTTKINELVVEVKGKELDDFIRSIEENYIIEDIEIKRDKMSNLLYKSQ